MMQSETRQSHLYLHSTMFLLILKVTAKKAEFGYEFTFHNVSINSRDTSGDEEVLSPIYIPQCFY